MNRDRPAPVLLVLLMALGTVMCAQPRQALADVPALSESLTGDAKTAYEGGKLLYTNRDFAGAATKFRAAYGASKDPRLLWNIAACEKEQRQYARAADLVDRYLREAGAVATPETLAQARETQAALRQFFSPVRLEVQPAGARVLIDGEEVGRSPLERAVPMDLGKHVLRVEKEGFAPSEQRFEVPGQRPMSLSVTLTALDKTGMLAITSAGGSDALTVDERPVGTGRWEGALPAGSHHVRIAAPGKKTYEADVQIAVRERRTIDVTLQDEGKAPLWPWIVGGAAVVTGAAVAGYFLFRPQDTQGPAPAGALGTVYLSWGR